MTAPVPTTTEILLAWDAKRPRSQQWALGMSEVGDCRKRAGFRLAGTEPMPTGSVPAVLGTFIHEAADEVFRDWRRVGLIPPNSLIGEELTFAGVTGHPDLIVPPMVRDVKTVAKKSMLDTYKLTGPPKRHQWQISLYAAATALRYRGTGQQISELQLDYIARDFGDTWQWNHPFDMDLVREAVIWLDIVRQTPLDILARDYAPDSWQCQGCPFRGPCWGEAMPARDDRSVLYIENPDTPKWVAQLLAARDARKHAERLEAEAKGALDALRPNDKGSALVEIPEMPGVKLRFTVSAPERLDTDQVKADYRRGGNSPPFRLSESVKITVLKD